MRVELKVFNATDKKLLFGYTCDYIPNKGDWIEHGGSMYLIECVVHSVSKPNVVMLEVLGT